MNEHKILQLRHSEETNTRQAPIKKSETFMPCFTFDTLMEIQFFDHIGADVYTESQ